MSRGGLRRLGGLLGPAVVVALGCGRVIADGGNEGDETGSGSAGDGSGGSSSGGSSGDTNSGTDSTDGGTSTGNTGSNGTSTDTTVPPCEPIQLADVAAGIGGFVLDGEAEWDWSGGAVSGAGDVDGDGLADVILGVRNVAANGIESAGRSYVVFGKTDTQAVSLVDVALGAGGFAMDGEAEHDRSGQSVSGAGDINGDGLADVIVGAPGAWLNGLSEAGRAYVVFGKADAGKVLLADMADGGSGFAMDGADSGDLSGFSVSEAGDVNGDGVIDVVVGAPGADPNGIWMEGRVYVVFGKADTDTVSLADVMLGVGGFVLHGEGGGPGWSLSAAGDVNDDGLADVVVGTDVAWAYVVFGKADTEALSLEDVTQGVGGFALEGEPDQDYAGWWVSGAGDVNGDGLADVVVGDWGADPNGFTSGRTYVVFGKTDTDRVQFADVALGTGGFVLDGEEAGDQSGRSVSGIGDLNGDGLADLIVGAYYASADAGKGAGRAYVVFGKTGTDAVALADVAEGIGGFALEGEVRNDRAGSAVSGAGDINGDGLPDLVIGARSASPNGLDHAGRTYVVFGGDFSCEDG